MRKNKTASMTSILLMITLTSIFLAGVVLLILLSRLMWGTPSSSLLDTPNPILDVCQVDSDCTLAIRVDVCSSCPEVATQARIRATKGVEIYIPGRNYGSLLPAICAWVDSFPCAIPLAGAICRSNRCQEPETVQEILAICPDCFVQAAQTAHQSGDMHQAIDLCTQAKDQHHLNTSDPHHLCFSQLFSVELAANRLNQAEQLCRKHMHRSISDCLRSIAQKWAKPNVEYAIALCDELDPNDARHFGCILDVVLAIEAQNQNRALEICDQLPVDKAELCRREVMK